MSRWILVLGLVMGSTVSLSGCGSDPVTTTSPVDACSILSEADAAAIFRTGTYNLQHRPPTNAQTICVYQGSDHGVSLITGVSWSKSAVSSFEKVHGAASTTVTATLPSGHSVSLPHFTKVKVDGSTAYWAAHQTLPITGTNTYPSVMTVEKRGYVVTLSATGLSESQNQQILSTMLRNLRC